MTRKFDLRQIMKAAWNTVKTTGTNLSSALKTAGAAAKKPVKVFTMTYQQWAEDSALTYLTPQPPAQFMNEVRNDWKGVCILELTSEKVVWTLAN